MEKEMKASEKKECNISVELWKAWQKLKLKGDPELIMEKYGYSRPVVDNAINFGYVKTAGVAENITEYFMDRLKNQDKDAAELVRLADNVNKS